MVSSPNDLSWMLLCKHLTGGGGALLFELGTWICCRKEFGTQIYHLSFQECVKERKRYGYGMGRTKMVEVNNAIELWDSLV